MTLVMGSVTVDGATLTPSSSFTTAGIGDATNTGVPAGWVPSQVITDRQVFTTVGHVFTDVQFDCTLDFRSGGNRFVRCLFRGLKDWAGKGRAIIQAVDPGCANGGPNVFEDSTFRPQTSLDTVDNFIGFNATFTRCDISGGVDGLDIAAPAGMAAQPPTLVDSCWIHDLAYYCPSNTHPTTNTTHNDGIQFTNANGVVVRNTTIEAFFDPTLGDASKPGVFDAAGKAISGNCNDVVKVPGQVGKVLGRMNGNAQLQFNGTSDNVQVIDCHLSGGVTGMNVVAVAAKSITVSGTVFGVPMYGKNTAVRGAVSTAAVVSVSGSTFEDGTPMLGVVGAGRFNQS